MDGSSFGGIFFEMMAPRAFGFLLLLLIIVGAVSGYRWFQDTLRYESVEIQPLRLRLPFPSPGILEKVTSNLATEQILSSSLSANRAVHSSSGNPPEVPETDLSPVEEEGGGAPVETDLALRLSRFAYIRYGRIGDRRIATFRDTRTRREFTAGLGGRVHGLKIVSVSNEFVGLESLEGRNVRKPRVDLEFQHPRAEPLTPERQQKLLIRYNELWGDPARYAATESGFTGEGEPRKRTPAEARKQYLDRLRAFDRAKRLDRPDEGLRDPALPTVGQSLFEEGYPVPREEPLPTETETRERRSFK